MAEVLMAYRARVAGGALTRDPAQDAAALRLDALAEHLRKWNPDFWFSKPPRGLYIWGAVGRGKSMLMDLFFEYAPVRKKQRVHFHEFMQARHAFMRRARAERDREQDDLIADMAKEVAEDARLLCFDEIQISDIADAMILGRLFEQLFARNVVIVATGNRPPDDFYKNGINRQLFLPFIDLFKDKLDIFELKAERDFRLERLMAAPVYYTPLGPAARHAMDDAWVRLTHGAKPKATAFDVQGRRVEAPRTAAGCARFTFAELCEQPLGPADYLELAARFNTILIDDIPLLTPDRKESAARLRILIDALYEAKAKLVCSAAAEPAALYPAGAQSFEFERTASRLMEMRSKDYLAAPRPDREAPAAARTQ
ncbi:MAG: cell division protein ZapE [Alphaproteobacteria bacterium]